MASKFYAVKKGKIPGIYNSWDDCKKMVDGFPGAVYKSFKTLEEAEAFVGAEGSSRKRSEKAEKPDTGKQEQNPAVYAFVDGSYNIATKVYGYGGFLVHNGEKRKRCGDGIYAQCFRRNIRSDGCSRTCDRVKTSGSDDLLRLHGNRDVGRGSLETKQAGHDRLL